jgi:hypothetical protein
MMEVAERQLGARPHSCSINLRHLTLHAEGRSADVSAVTGSRHELFGKKVPALKRGKLALAIAKGPVAATERGSWASDASIRQGEKSPEMLP